MLCGFSVLRNYETDFCGCHLAKASEVSSESCPMLDFCRRKVRARAQRSENGVTPRREALNGKRLGFYKHKLMHIKGISYYIYMLIIQGIWG